MGSTQENIRESITNKIISALEAGVKPWRKPWAGGSPINIASKKEYRGINVALLAIHQWQHKLKSNVYGTVKQWNDVGLKVKKRPDDVVKGDYGATIIFYKQVKLKQKDTQEVQEDKTIPLLNTYQVFNAEQVEGGVEYVQQRQEKNAIPVDVHAHAESVIEAYCSANEIEVVASGRAAYYPSKDFISMPPRDTFTLGTNSYYGTYFHELAHSTGHESRLNREFSRFGSNAYALEELVAEIAGCYCLSAVGLPVMDQLENHANYVANWLEVLKKDKKAIFQASTAATKAADMILKPIATEVEESELEMATA